MGDAELDGDTLSPPRQAGAPVREADGIAITFLAEGEQTAESVAGRLAAFIGGARRSLDMAIYDFRLAPATRALVEEALRERAAAGVAIRIAYDADKPAQPNPEAGMDPAPAGTGAFVASLGFPSRGIDGLKLMHHKYVVRDAALPSARTWTGSTNLTDDSWTLQENNILQLASPTLAVAYARDFEQLWRTGTLDDTGDFTAPDVATMYAGAPASVRVEFSPGCGPEIDDRIARLVASAERRVRICSMLLNSGALLGALRDVLRAGRVPVDGVYDRTQMAGVLRQWQDVPHNRWKIDAVREIAEAAGLVGKDSTPYSPTSRHDFMHAKILVVDDTVITGSYNFSRSAELNAENILFIRSAALAEEYGRFIDHLKAKYGGGDAGAERGGQ